MRAYIIVDLGFGDAGKGLLTDFLVRDLKAGLVVRYNGGAQAGHNVVAPDGRHHTFSQFGSGTFNPGVRTYLSRYVVVHPSALLAEGDILQEKGVESVFSRLRISDQALIITPFHQAANRIRESARGENRHGSCGVGVGEAVEDAAAYPEDCLLAGDLASPAGLRRKLIHLRERKRGELSDLREKSSAGSRLEREWGIFEDEEAVAAWMESVERFVSLGLVVPDTVLEKWLGAEDHVVFEGAQGLLLDAELGFHPYTTWSRCTAGNAFDLIKELAPGSNVSRIGIIRAYAVRHGPGPLPTQTDELADLITEHNQENEWQGAVRYGWFDAVLARYALAAAGGADALALTHLDILPRLEEWRYCPGYQRQQGQFACGAAAQSKADLCEDLPFPAALRLEDRVRLTRMLGRAIPRYESCPAEERMVIGKVESLLRQPVNLVSRGAGAGDVCLYQPLP